jgi:hypothetical protein
MMRWMKVVFRNVITKKSTPNFNEQGLDLAEQR